MSAIPLPGLPEGFCSVKEVANRLKCSPGFIVSLIEQGLLTGKKEPFPGAIGYHWLVNLESLESFESNYELSGERRKTAIRKPEALIRRSKGEEKEITHEMLWKALLALHRRMDDQGWPRDR